MTLVPPGFLYLGLIPCDDHSLSHRMAMSPRGRLALLDHGPYRRVRLLSSFGADVPQCALFVSAWNRDPLNSIYNCHSPEFVALRAKILAKRRYRRFERRFRFDPLAYIKHTLSRKFELLRRLFADALAASARMTNAERRLLFTRVNVIRRRDEYRCCDFDSVAVPPDCIPGGHTDWGLYVVATITTDWLALKPRIVDGWFVVGRREDGRLLAVRRADTNHGFPVFESSLLAVGGGKTLRVGRHTPFSEAVVHEFKVASW